MEHFDIGKSQETCKVQLKEKIKNKKKKCTVHTMIDNINAPTVTATTTWTDRCSITCTSHRLSLLSPHAIQLSLHNWKQKYKTKNLKKNPNILWYICKYREYHSSNKKLFTSSNAHEFWIESVIIARFQFVIRLHLYNLNTKH